MSHRRDRWSDDPNLITNDSSNVWTRRDTRSDAAHMRRSDGSDSSLLLLWNCVLPDEVRTDASSAIGRSLLDAFHMSSDEWPACFSQSRVYAFREIGVPLQPGLCGQNRTANVLRLVVVLCDTPTMLDIARTTPCNKVRKTSDELHGFQRGSVTIVANGVSAASLCTWPPEQSWELHDLVKLDTDLRVATMLAIGKAAEAQGAEIESHMMRHPTCRKKAYARDHERMRIVLQNLQRLKRRFAGSEGRASLVTQPVQLGFGSMSEWTCLDDCCRSRSESKHLHCMLKRACSCGRMSWKLRYVDGECLTPRIPPTEWINVLLHQIKEQVMQRFFRGSVLLDAEGMVQATSEGDAKMQYSMVFLTESAPQRAENIRHHVCFVLPLDCVTRAHAVPVSALPQAQVLTAAVLEQGEFELTQKWEGVGRKVL
jgi:hypothetical protein